MLTLSTNAVLMRPQAAKLGLRASATRKLHAQALALRLPGAFSTVTSYMLLSNANKTY